MADTKNDGNESIRNLGDETSDQVYQGVAAPVEQAKASVTDSATASAAKAEALAADVCAKYIDPKGGVSEELFRQLFQEAVKQNHSVTIDGVKYGEGQADEVIAILKDLKENNSEPGHSEKLSSAVTVLVVNSNKSMQSAVTGNDAPLSETEKQELYQYIDLLNEGAKAAHENVKLEDEINTDVETNLTSTLSDSLLLTKQVKDLAGQVKGMIENNDGRLDKRALLTSIRTAFQATDTACHIGHLAKYLEIEGQKGATVNAAGIGEAQLAASVAATFMGIVNVLQNNKDMSAKEKADVGFNTVISANNSALAFLLLMGGKVSQVQAAPIQDAVAIITMFNVVAQVARKGVACDKKELLDTVGTELARGMPHIGGRLAQSLGMAGTGPAAVMAALTLVSNELIHQKDMLKKDAENVSSKEDYLQNIAALRADGKQMELYESLVCRHFADNDSVKGEAHQQYKAYKESFDERMYDYKLQAAKVSAGYQADIQKRAVERGIEVANVAITFAAMSCPPVQLGTLVTGALSLSMSVAGNRIIEKTANNNFNIPSLTDDAILISDVASANRIVINRDIRRYYQPNIVLMREVMSVGEKMDNPQVAVMDLLQRAKNKTVFNLAFPKSGDKDYIDQLGTWRKRMEFMQALKAQIGQSATNLQNLKIYPFINNLDQLISKLQDQGRELLSQYENEIAKMGAGQDERIAGNITYLKDQYDENNKLKLADSFKQQTPEEFLSRMQELEASDKDAQLALGGALGAATSGAELGKGQSFGDKQQEYGKFVLRMFDELSENIEAATTIQANLDPEHNQMIKNHQLMMDDFKEQRERLMGLVEKGQLTIDPEFAQQVEVAIESVQEKLEDLQQQIKAHNILLAEHRIEEQEAKAERTPLVRGVKRGSGTVEAKSSDTGDVLSVVIERGKYNALAVLAMRKNIMDTMKKIHANPNIRKIKLEMLLTVNETNINQAQNAKEVHDRMVGLQRALHHVVGLQHELNLYKEETGIEVKIPNLDEIVANYTEQIQLLGAKRDELMAGDAKSLTISERGKLDNVKNNMELFFREVGDKALAGVYKKISDHKQGRIKDSLQAMRDISASSTLSVPTVAGEVDNIANDIMRGIKHAEVVLEHPQAKMELGDVGEDVLRRLANIAREIEMEQDKIANEEGVDLDAVAKRLAEYAQKFQDVLADERLNTQGLNPALGGMTSQAESKRGIQHLVNEVRMEAANVNTSVQGKCSEDGLVAMKDMVEKAQKAAKPIKASSQATLRNTSAAASVSIGGAEPQRKPVARGGKSKFTIRNLSSKFKSSHKKSSAKALNDKRFALKESKENESEQELNQEAVASNRGGRR